MISVARPVLITHQWWALKAALAVAHRSNHIFTGLSGRGGEVAGRWQGAGGAGKDRDTLAAGMEEMMSEQRQEREIKKTVPEPRRPII